MRFALPCLLALACGPQVQPVPVQEPSTAPLVTSSASSASSATAAPPAPEPTHPVVRATNGDDFDSAGDRDGDGLPDNVDKCPDAPEDRDGFQDLDGCPDPDNDGDGVLDVNDKCPNTPGKKPDGCP